MKRSALLWMLAGAAPVACAVMVMEVISIRQSDGLFLRVFDDADIGDGEYQWEKVGAVSAMLARKCKIDRFEHDLVSIDHTGSTFVSIDDIGTDKLDCLIGEARIAGLSIAISRGTDPIAPECLPGQPARFQPAENINQQAAFVCGRLQPEAAQQMKADEKKR